MLSQLNVKGDIALINGGSLTSNLGFGLNISAWPSNTAISPLLSNKGSTGIINSVSGSVVISSGDQLQEH